METKILQKIIDQRLFPGDTSAANLVETHISWVILTPEFAFKVKKPVQFDFLDFSTIEQRHFYCTEELRLNKRLAADMYLGVLPVGEGGIGKTPVLDYAVQMKRIDNHRQLDHLLETENLHAEELNALAIVLAGFHQKVALKGVMHYNPEAIWQDFADLLQHRNLLEQHLGKQILNTIEQQFPLLQQQLRQWDTRLLDRAQLGFWVEGHGDLHSRNIFLTEPPLAFDCIEFSRHFREMDVLNELAFLCMDLEYYQRSDMAQHFMRTYRQQFDVMPKEDDAPLFLFFKAYRANVRLKVSLLQMEQHPGPELLQSLRRYWELLNGYLQELASDLHI